MDGTPWDRFFYLMWELELVTRCAADGTATEMDIRGTEDALDAVLEELGMTAGQAMEAMYRKVMI